MKGLCHFSDMPMITVSSHGLGASRNSHFPRAASAGSAFAARAADGDP
jgi:hypothetical protein